MPTNVLMPQLGESIAEGTIVRWNKQIGDSIDRDEALFEISTDKVDAEIPSPVAGVLSEVRVAEGETVPVDFVVAVIGETVAASADDESRERPVSPDSVSALTAAEAASVPSAAKPGAQASPVVRNTGTRARHRRDHGYRQRCWRARDKD